MLDRHAVDDQVERGDGPGYGIYREPARHLPFSSGRLPLSTPIDAFIGNREKKKHAEKIRSTLQVESDRAGVYG